MGAPKLISLIVLSCSIALAQACASASEPVQVERGNPAPADDRDDVKGGSQGGSKGGVGAGQTTTSKAPDSRRPSKIPDESNPTVPPSTNYSNGSGGATGQIQEARRFSYQGLTSQFRLWAPASNGNAEAHRLVVFLHGDTGSNYGPPNLDPRIDNQYFAYGQPRPTLDQALSEGSASPNSIWNKTIFISILSPADNGQFITWNTGLSDSVRNQNADFIDRLLKAEVLPRYNVNLDEVFFVGQSGGGIFLSGTFIPRHGSQYKGGAIMLCGATPPRRDLGFSPNANFWQSFKVHFQTTAGEYTNLAPDIAASHQAYRQLAGTADYATLVNQGNGGHCEFPTNSQPALLGPIIERMISLNRGR